MIEIADYIAAAARAFGVPEAEIMSTGRSQRVARPRIIAAYLALEAGYTVTELARELRRDHSSIVYYRDRVDYLRKRKDSRRLRAQIAKVKAEIS